MAKNTIHLLRDEQLLNTIKANAKQHIKRFSLSTVLKEYEAIYEKCF